MNAIVISSLVITGTLLLGALLAVAVRWFSNLIDHENAAAAAKDAGYQPAVSFGHNIPLEADIDDQIQEARKLAARRAANLPRGANVTIGQAGDDQQKTSFDGLNADPVSAVKMAYFHSWAGLKTGLQESATAASPAKGVAEAVAPVKSSGDLVPGKDYPVIEITEGMEPAEKRKARIANAKAKSAALKQAKAAGVTPVVAASSPAVQPAAETQAETPPAMSEARAPVAGIDYAVIDITDDMAPDEVRAARIANAKAKSAANKKFKAAGAVATAPTVEIVEESVQSPAQPVDDPIAQAISLPADIPAPNYVEITEEMDKEEVRKFRIQNAKEKSAYNKALRAAGIDPKSVK